MATISTTNRADPTETAGEARHRHPLSDRLLDALGAWIEMRTSRQRARAEAAIERAANAPVRVVHAEADWWRSWRACARRRGCQR